MRFSTLVRSFVGVAFVALVGCEVGSDVGGGDGDASDGFSGGPPASAGGGTGTGSGGEFAPGPIIAPGVAPGPIEAGPADDAGDEDGGKLRDAGDPCGNGKLDTGEKCDPASDACCNDTCSGARRKGTTCREAGGACDVAEACDGSAFACPADDVRGFASVCRSAVGACDIAEICNGVDKACPMDTVAPDNVQCGTASGACDADDFCDGSAKSCPDLVKPDTATCGGSPTGACDVQDYCDGSSKSCAPQYALAGAFCGSAADTECNNRDTCDGAGNCLENYEPVNTNCGDQGVACHNDDKCDGQGTCNDNGVKAQFTPCGSSSSTSCDAPDSCNTSGTCVDRVDSTATLCRPAAGECDVAENCTGGAKTCPVDLFKDFGTACGGGGDECNSADSCNGGGSCVPRPVQNGDPCGDQGVDCRADDQCQNGACQDNGLLTDGEACGDQTTSSCDKPDACDGSAVCQPNYDAPSTPCGDQGVDCHEDDACDGAGSCTDNGFSEESTSCGDESPLDDDCDNPDSCDASGQCQLNHQPEHTGCTDEDPADCDDAQCNDNGECTQEYESELQNYACGSQADTECDNPDRCDDSGTCLPQFQLSGSACGDGTMDACTNADQCNGLGACSPRHVLADAPCPDTNLLDCLDAQCNGSGTCDQGWDFEGSGTACGDGANTTCSNPDTCNASGTCLPNHALNSTSCRADAGECDVAETCSDGVCPPNGFESAGVACTDTATGDCKDAQCNGSGACNQTQANETMGHACGDQSSTTCSSPDTCDAGGTCLSNHALNSVVCRPGSECDVAETCNSGVCPVDGFETAGTSCTDSTTGDCKDAACNGSGACSQAYTNETMGYLCGDQTTTTCTAPDICDAGGVCLPNHASNSTICRADAGECDVADTCNNGACPVDGFEVAGVVCTDSSPTNCFDAKCDGIGGCNQVQFQRPLDALCGDPADDDCLNPDVCNMAGACVANDELNGTPCPDGDDNKDCFDAQCQAGSCNQAGGQRGTNAPCGSSDDTECDAPDQCDPSGECIDRLDGEGAVCRPEVPGGCDIEEVCDGSTKPCPADDVLPSETVCRPSEGECDIEESCQGQGDPNCPPDGFQPEFTACNRGPIGFVGNLCDAPDSCDGGGVCDPRYAPAMTPCGDPTDDDCKNPDQCNGTGLCNLGDEPPGTECGNQTDCTYEACDLSAICQRVDDELDGKPCVIPPGSGPATCSTGLCCPGATTNDGSGCGFPGEDDVVFVTSLQIPGNQINGRAGGRQICNTLAQAANLGSTYTPWLGDSFFDVFVDISDGPYRRVDGAPIAPSKSALLNTPMPPMPIPLQVPIEITQLNLVSVQPIVLTGLLPNGQPTPNNCADWQVPITGPQGQADIGFSNQVGPDWTWAGSLFPCDQPMPFYCFQDDCPGQPDVDFQNDPNNCGSCGNVCNGTCAFGECQGIVFVTSTGNSGAFGGLDGADTFCQSHAASVVPPLPGTYTAWLGAQGVNAYDRILDQPHVRTDGAPVAVSIAQLTDASTFPLDNPIDVDESKNLTSETKAWTGTGFAGEAFPVHCQSWTTTSDAGAYGIPQATDKTWTYDSGASFDCQVARPIYCFQTGPVGEPIVVDL